MPTLHPEHAYEPESEIEVRHHFDGDLDEIRRNLVTMASMVLENVQRAGVVAVENRLDLVDTVRDADLPINDLYQRLEQRTFEILALQQPVASDLRFLIATTRMLYEIERSGDLAVNIANRTASQHGFPQIEDLNLLLARLANESATVFALAIEAIANLDSEIGINAEESDDIVDVTTDRFFAKVHAHSTELGLECAVELSHVGRFFERIADHGVNVAQNVTYVMTGVFPDGEDTDGPE